MPLDEEVSALVTVFRTDDYQPSERIDAWRDALSSTYVPFDIGLLSKERFSGSISVDNFGGLEASTVASGGQLVRRTRWLVDHTNGDYYKIALPVSGQCVVRQRGREAPLEPGDLALYDCGQPFDVAFSGPFELLSFMFPRHLLRLPTNAVDGSLAVPVPRSNSLGALLRPLLVSLVEQMDRLPASSSQRVADTVLDLLVTVLSELTATTPEDGDPLRRTLLLQIKSYIESRLGERDLSPGEVADAHHISYRYLYKLFQAERETVARYIRQRRLERCRRDLADATQNNIAVAAIAERWGFADAANFSSAFRSEYGVSPREYRLHNAEQFAVER